MGYGDHTHSIAIWMVLGISSSSVAYVSDVLCAACRSTCSAAALSKRALSDVFFFDRATNSCGTFGRNRVRVGRKKKKKKRRKKSSRCIRMRLGNNCRICS